MTASTPRLVGRYLRAGGGGAVVVAVVVAILAALGACAPVAVTALLDASTDYRVGQLSAPVRDLTGSINRAPAVGPAAGDAETDLPAQYAPIWGQFDETLRAVRAGAPATLREAYGQAEYVVRFGNPGLFAPTTWVVVDPRYASHIRIVDGRMPEGDGDVDEWFAALGYSSETGEAIEPEEAPPTEIVMSAASAESVDWKIGETRDLGRGEGWNVAAPMTLVGTFDLVDPDDPYWSRAGQFEDAVVASNPDGGQYLRTTAYAAPEELATLRYATFPLTRVWYPMDPGAVTAASAPTLLAQLNAFTATSVTMKTDGSDVSLRFQTGAISTLQSAVAQNRALVAVVAVLVSGPVGVGIAVLVLGCRMIAERRRPAIALLAARGASPGLQRGLLALEGAIAGIVPAVVGVLGGLLIARAVWADAIATLPPAAVTIALLPLALGLLPAVVLAATAPRARGRVDEARSSRWRLVAEAVLVVLAVLATVLLVLRGAETEDGGVDPLAVAAPALLAVVAGLVTLRLVPLALRGILARRARGDGYVGLLGAARALRDPATGLAPVFALLVGVAVAVSSGILLSVLQIGASDGARAGVGADLSVTAPRIDDDTAERIAALDGVEETVVFASYPAAALEVDGTRERVTVTIADIDRLRAVQEGYPSVVEGVDFGDGTGSVPLLFSAREEQRTGAGSAAELSILGAPAAFSGASSSPVPFSSTPGWVLADAAYADAFDEDRPIPSLMLLKLDGGADVTAVAEAVRAELDDPAVRTATVAQQLDERRGDPIWDGLRVLLVASVVVCAALGALAVVIALVLGAGGRRRLFALLQTLGAPPRAGRRLIVWEIAPAAVAALVLGAVFGALLPLLLMAVIDLRPFTGGTTPPGYAVDPVILLAAVGGFLVVAAIVTVIALALTRRSRAAAVLRTVEDT